MLSVAVHGVCIEPHLQPLSGECLRHRTDIREDGARLDIAASGVWGGQFERALFDIQVFKHHAYSNSVHSLHAWYAMHEREATFVPLVFSAAGGQGKTATSFYKQLGLMVSEKGMSLTRSPWHGLDVGWGLPLFAQQLHPFAAIGLGRSKQHSRHPLS